MTDMALELCRRGGLADMIREKCGDGDPLIALKPNLVGPIPASDGATTHPEIAEAVLSEMARRIQFYMQKWAGGAMQVEVVVFSNVYGELAATECASEFIRILRQELTDAAKGGY